MIMAVNAESIGIGSIDFLESARFNCLVAEQMGNVRGIVLSGPALESKVPDVTEKDFAGDRQVSGNSPATHERICVPVIYVFTFVTIWAQTIGDLSIGMPQAKVMTQFMRHASGRGGSVDMGTRSANHPQPSASCCGNGRPRDYRAIQSYCYHVALIDIV